MTANRMPNFQSILKVSRENNRLKAEFVKDLPCADYTELEQRILQNLNNSDYISAEVRAALSKGEDPYRVTASKIFSVSVSEVTEDQRRYAKTVDFLAKYATGGKP